MHKFKVLAVAFVLSVALIAPAAQLVRVGAGGGWSVQPAVALADECSTPTCGGH